MTPREFLRNIAANLACVSCQSLAEFVTKLSVLFTPVVVLDRQGRTCYCSMLARNFAEQQLIENACRVPLNSFDLSSQLDESMRSLPLVDAWLDSKSVLDGWNIQVSAHCVGTASFPLTAFSIIRAEPKDDRSARRQAAHDLVNAAASVQVLIDLLEEGASDQARAEYLKLLQISMHDFRKKIDREAGLLELPCPHSWEVNIVLERIVQHYGSLAGKRKCRITIGEVAEPLLRRRVVLDTATISSLDQVLSAFFARVREKSVVTLSCEQIDAGFELDVQCSGTLASALPKGIELHGLSPTGQVSVRAGPEGVAILLPVAPEALPPAIPAGNPQTDLLKRCG